MNTSFRSLTILVLYQRKKKPFSIIIMNETWALANGAWQPLDNFQNQYQAFLVSHLKLYCKSNRLERTLGESLKDPLKKGLTYFRNRMKKVNLRLLLRDSLANT